MPGKHTIARREDGFLTGELRTIETPAWIFYQLLVTFIVPIYRIEEGFRIRDMNGYRDAQTAAFLPNGIESRIIHGDQLARLVVYLETEISQDFQPASPA